MQHKNLKKEKLHKTIGKILKQLRIRNSKMSLNKFSYSYEIDRGNLSKIEKGLVGCSITTAWRITEALGVSFSEFALLLEKELGKDFKLMDE